MTARPPRLDFDALPPAVTDSEVVAILKQISGQLDAIAAGLIAARATPPMRLAVADAQALDGLLPVLAGLYGGELFTVNDLMLRCSAPDGAGLRLALETICDGRKLGRLLKRGTGIPRHGLVVHRIGSDRAGALWKIAPSGE